MEVQAKNYRYSAGFEATASPVEYTLVPINGRPHESYFALINTGTGSLYIAFGDKGVTPADVDYIEVSPGGSFEPLAGFFSKGDIYMNAKGTEGSPFVIVR